MQRFQFFAIAALASMACDDATDVNGSDGGQIKQNDAGPDASADRPLQPPPIDAGPDARPGNAVGENCQSRFECEGGLCVTRPGTGGGVCTASCLDGEADDCPDSWRCINSVELGGFVCQPPLPGALCSPCAEDADCGGDNDDCHPLLGMAGSRACGRDCRNNECPSEFTCQALGDDRQCLPNAGLCPEAPMDDLDNDSVRDMTDNCPLDPNPTQADSEGDGWGDECDNCVNLPNPGQNDVDGDGLGDVCDNVDVPPVGYKVGPGRFVGLAADSLTGQNRMHGVVGNGTPNGPMRSGAYTIETISFGNQ